jgi:glycosyltransferase involved in cell wall biosynthesis
MASDVDRTELDSQAQIKKTPKVSIGMPVYNGEKFIHRALDSLLGQTFTDFELIVSDNASTDATGRICLEYAAKDQRIHYHRSEVNLEPGLNFKCVLDDAIGEYFMWAAHDDRWDPLFVERLVEALDSDPQTVLAFCRFVNIEDSGGVTRTFKENWRKVFSRSKFWQFAFMTLSDELRTQKANHIYGLIRRAVLVECGGVVILPNVTYAGEDILTLLRLLAKGNFTIVDEVLFHYRARSHTTRRDEPLAGYIWQRIAQQKSGHQGNLVLFFIRNRAYHSSMRKFIMNETSLSFFEKLLLWLAILLKEISFPISFLPMGVLRELRVLRY